MSRISVGLVLALAGCGGDDGGGMGTYSSEGVTGSDSAVTSSAETAAEETGADDAADGAILDVAATTGGTAETGDGEGCEKIDFLFVIDNSGSMEYFQQQLLASFGPFMDTILENVDAHDFHVMVVSTEGFPHEGQPYLGQTFYPSSCDDTRGAGQTNGCNMPTADRYLSTASDFDLVKSSFECIADLGTGGWAWEFPMQASVNAVTVESQPGGCNEGFLRDDAILVVTYLTDDSTQWQGEDEVYGFGDTPQKWFDDIVAAKGGVPENVVVLGFFSDGMAIGCDVKADPFYEFTSLFGNRGLAHSICEEDYVGPLTDAVALIDTTCDEFVPVD